MRLIAVFRAAGLRFSADGCAFAAQAIAFNALFAVFPLAILAIAALGFVYGSQEAQAKAAALFATVAPGIQDILMENLHQLVNARSIWGVIAVVTLAWSGKNLFQALAYALNRTLGIPQGRPLIGDILVSLVTLPVLALLLLVATALPIGLSIAVQLGGFARSGMVAQIAGYATGFALIFTVSALLYTYLPNHRAALTFGIPGALFTAVSWEIAQIAFGIYTTHVNFFHVYGAVATFAVLLLWFYYMGIIFLFGAELSAQWAEARRASGREGGIESLKTA